MTIRVSVPLIVFIAASLQGCAAGSTASAGQEASAVAAATAPVPVTEVVANAITTAATAESLAAIAVHEVEGSILITGQVLSEEEKARVSNAAAFAAGGQLRRLSNELRVVERIDLSLAEPDASLATAANALLASTEPSLAGQIEAVVENACVYLLGRVTRAQGDAAAQLVSGLEGVAAVKVVFDYTD